MHEVEVHEEFARTTVHPFARFLAKRPIAIVAVLYAFYAVMAIVGVRSINVRAAPRANIPAPCGRDGLTDPARGRDRLPPSPPNPKQPGRLRRYRCRSLPLFNI